MTAAATVEAQQNDMLAHILDILACPVCLKPMLSPPIFICDNEHGLCQDCHQKLTKNGQDCPVCRAPLTQRRNLMLEQVIQGLPKRKCKFQSCDFARADIELVENHEVQDCKYRKVECFHCGKNKILSTMYVHLAAKHEAKVRAHFSYGVPETRCIKLASPHHQTKTTLLLLGEITVHFYLNIFWVEEGRYYLIWISHDLSKLDTRTHRYSFILLCGKTIDAEDKKEPVLEFSAFSQPLDVNLGTIKKKLLGLTVSADVMNEALDANEFLHYKFVISKVQ